MSSDVTMLKFKYDLKHLPWQGDCRDWKTTKCWLDLIDQLRYDLERHGIGSPEFKAKLDEFFIITDGQYRYK